MGVFAWTAHRPCLGHCPPRGGRWT
jgi:hypothetical protein